MIELRPFASLGHADHGWLKAAHHFSFAEYRDPSRMGWGALRVWNDDEIAPNTGFPAHPHRDMEIITYVRTGAISHKDSLGNEGRTEAGQVQVMSAGTGIVHSEVNIEPVTTTLFQIWILPDRRGHAPSWGTRPFPVEARDNRLVTLASGVEGDEDALRINATARVKAATLRAGSAVQWELAPGWSGYVVLASGAARLRDLMLHKRDGAAIRDERTLIIHAEQDSEIVIVETIG
ncbi:hypothetical protein C0V97_06485 [Asaia sp. W19]|uniref:pirin family protein n=1 Tax=unclassified Asaia TaxID=2685023 RepID=UPI000F8D1473|nr:pirin-like bicupin family protein [Asaia sp. W19]RUT26468.1 hypothetical protein C0V97_06485 [Asaia sp. W19]